MNNEARWMGAPGYEVGRPRMATADPLYLEEVQLYEAEQRQKLALAARVDQEAVHDLERIRRKLERDTTDAQALQRAERSGNVTLANAIRARMMSRNNGVDV